MKNMGKTDRIVRILLGILLLLAAIFWLDSGIYQILAYILGALFLLTGLAGVCLVYKLFGYNGLKQAAVPHPQQPTPPTQFPPRPPM
ncbi:MAG: DUF2892 domain-containing protein [Acidobacteriaceae bacterium]